MHTQTVGPSAHLLFFKNNFIADIESMHIINDIEVDREPKPANWLGCFRHVKPAVESDMD